MFVGELLLPEMMKLLLVVTLGKYTQYVLGWGSVYFHVALDRTKYAQNRSTNASGSWLFPRHFFKYSQEDFLKLLVNCMLLFSQACLECLFAGLSHLYSLENISQISCIFVYDLPRFGKKRKI